MMEIATLRAALREAHARGAMLIHNVRDRHRNWIGTWEVEPLDYGSLGPEHVGREVVYHDHRRAELGIITSWCNGLVFARYSTGDTAAGAEPESLSLVVRRVL
jgi:hypothetical protein